LKAVHFSGYPGGGPAACPTTQSHIHGGLS